MTDSDTQARLQRIGLNEATWLRLQAGSEATSPEHRGSAEHDPATGLDPAAGPTPEASPSPNPLGEDTHARSPQQGLAPASWWRITEVQRQHLWLHDGEASLLARPRLKLVLDLQDQADALAVGDWVLARPDAQGGWWVEQRMPPLNQIARRLHDGRDKVERVVIVSNVDLALLVMGLDADFSPTRLARYLTLVRLAQVPAGVVLTKADLCDDPAARLAEVRRLLPPGVQAVAVAGQQPEAARALAPWLGPGCTGVLLGSSGAGKSTLTNTLCGQAVQRTGGTRLRDGRGRHTTTVRSLHRLPSGACLIDTPGLRTLRLDSDEAALGQVFDDVATLAAQCRFRNCRHGAEPGCAVRAGLPDERVDHFHKLSREARRDQMSALERQRQRADWKARGRAGAARAAAKRGE